MIRCGVNHLDEVRALHRAGRSSEALTLCRALLERDASNAELLAIAGTLALRLDEVTGAERYLSEAVARAPESTEARFNWGNALVRLDRRREAIAQFERVITQRPDLLQAHNNLGNALYDLRELSAAEAAFRRALTLAPKTAHLHRNLGTVLREQGALEPALSCFVRALGLRPDWVKAQQSLTTTAMELGRWQTALDVCGAWLHSAPANAEALGLASIALDELGRHAEADRLLDFERLFRQIQLSGPPLEFASLDDFNAALVRHTLDHPTLHAPPANDPRYHCPTLRMTGEFCAEPKGPAASLERIVLDALHGFAADLARELPTHPFVVGAAQRFELKSWSTVLDREGNLEPHVHYASYLSAVYYPKIPAGMTSSAPGAGFLELGGGPTRFPTRYSRPVRAIEPREGLLVLFPSYFYHRTAPFSASDVRVAIAFDTVPVDQRQASGDA